MMAAPNTAGTRIARNDQRVKPMDSTMEQPRANGCHRPVTVSASRNGNHASKPHCLSDSDNIAGAADVQKAELSSGEGDLSAKQCTHSPVQHIRFQESNGTVRDSENSLRISSNGLAGPSNGNGTALDTSVAVGGSMGSPCSNIPNGKSRSLRETTSSGTLSTEDKNMRDVGPDEGLSQRAPADEPGKSIWTDVDPSSIQPPANANDTQKLANGVVSYSELGGAESPNVLIVQRKWQMAGCVHFLLSFKQCLPLSSAFPATAAALSPVVLERAVGDPAADSISSVVYRDVITSLLIALKELSSRATDRWFSALQKFIVTRAQEFPDCFDENEGECLLDRFDGDGMNFIYYASWQCRLGLLQSLCDITAEEADCVRDVLREAERVTTAARQEVEARDYRLHPLGRCSQKRFYYYVGNSRIYSGYKRKGAGGVCVECSDLNSMRDLVDALDASDEPRDCALGAKIRSWYLTPLEQAESKKQKKLDRDLALEVQREESRRRNADRPRRSRAAYV